MHLYSKGVTWTHAGGQSMSVMYGFGAVVVVYSTEGLFVNQAKLRVKFGWLHRLSLPQTLDLVAG